MQSLETISGHQSLRNDFPETNVWEFPEVMATAGGCSDCWKPRRVADDVHNMMENALFILIFIIFAHNYNKPIVEETLTSGKYISLLTPSINMTTGIIFEEITQ